jgi:hypothetical protein
VDIQIRKLTPELTDDWSALMDTSYAVIKVAILLLAVTIILNMAVLIVYYRRNSKDQ